MTYKRGNGTFHRGFTRREFLQAGAVVGAGLWTLSALSCGKTETKQTPATTPAAKQPKSGGTFNFVGTFDPQGMDPHTATAGTMLDISDFFYSTPIRFKATMTGYDLEPDVVESWEQPDNVTYIMHVRKGVKFHNLPPVNGREMTAEDIKYSFDRIATNKPAFQRRWMFSEVDKAEVVDKYTVKLTTKRPFVPMMSYLADRYTKIVAKEAVEAKGDLEAIFIGTGSFVMESFTHNVGAKLKKNPDYFVPGRPYLDAVNVPLVTDASARLAALRARELDWAPITFSDMEALKKNPGDMQFATMPGAHQELVLATNLRLPLNKPPFNDVRVRRALQLGVDRQKLLAAVADGKGIITGPIAPYLKDWALPNAELTKYLRYDPEEAKKLLTEAGHGSGLRFSCNASTARKGWADTAVILKEQYKVLGIDVEVKVMEHSAYVAAQVARDFETMVGATYVDGADPDFVYNILYSKGPRQFSNYNNPKMDELLEKQRGLFDKEERKKVLLEIQRTALEDVPEVHLFQADGFFVWQPYVKNFLMGLGNGYRQSFDYWLDK
ncbi:MAG: ABC transporter substrate-binding protein [Candidatus Marsarchaeota archaeon]|nr:ABC transporter substrate-binding protein [Candidatus Marsarchaeota archaeon]